MSLRYASGGGTSNPCFAIADDRTTAEDLAHRYVHEDTGTAYTTIHALGLEVVKGCQGSVAVATVRGVTRAITFSTAQASGVLNITNTAVDYDTASGVLVCLSLQVRLAWVCAASKK